MNIGKLRLSIRQDSAQSPSAWRESARRRPELVLRLSFRQVIPFAIQSPSFDATASHGSASGAGQLRLAATAHDIELHTVPTSSSRPLTFRFLVPWFANRRR